ncbi:MAG: polynucleotide adenylyltransferase PcnB [Myxococcales bacterium]|nr:polynucleotide adenylyltransferase PcnB [Myxococcales bacterium]
MPSRPKKVPVVQGPIRTQEHPITIEDIDADAHRVVRRLHQCGHEAYLVGGSVRDLMLRKSPKDFDIATGASPNEVRKIFRNCRLIGRRFRLAHLLFADGKVLEVATFREAPEGIDEDSVVVSPITDDNEFGTAETDARRRDFTVNGLFFDPQSNEVIDYVGGLADLDRRLLRTIGDPVVRFREDPVRMLRAIKFAARTGFDIEPAARKALRTERKWLKKAAIPRIYEEIVRMMWGGAAASSFHLLEDVGLLEILLPEVSAWLSRRAGDPAGRLHALLTAVDHKCKGKPHLENGVLLAALFWGLYDDLATAAEARKGKLDNIEERKLAETVIGAAAVRLRIPRKDIAALLTALELQRRFPHYRERRTARMGLARHHAFPTGLDLLELRTEAFGLDLDALADWQSLRDVPRERPDDDDFAGGHRQPRRRRRH